MDASESATRCCAGGLGACHIFRFWRCIVNFALSNTACLCVLAPVGTLCNSRTKTRERHRNGNGPVPALLLPVGLRETRVREGLHQNGDTSDVPVATRLAGMNKST